MLITKIICYLILFIVQSSIAQIENDNYVVPAIQFFKVSKLYQCEISINKDKEIQNTGPQVLENQGSLVTDCGSKQYLFSNKIEQYANIWKQCASLGGRPASIEQKSDLQCLHQRYFLQSATNDSSIFFTGQLDSNLNRRIISCSTNNTVPSDIWFEGEPNNAMGREACVAIKFNNKTAGLIDVRCGEFSKFVCEVVSKKEEIKEKFVTRVAPTYSPLSYIYLKQQFANNTDVCIKRSCQLFPFVEFNITDLTKADNTKGILLTNCADRYFLLTKRKHAIDHFAEVCCGVGMESAKIETREELNCISNTFNAKTKSKSFEDGGFAIGYSDHKLNRTFVSCPHKTKINDELWLPYQPDNQNGMEGCVVASLYGDKKIIGFDDVRCMNKYYLMCQYIPPNFVLPKPSTISLSNVATNSPQKAALKKLQNPKMYEYLSVVKMYFKSLKYKNDICEAFTCKMNSDLAYQFENSIKGDTSKGLLITSCGRSHYFLSRNKVESIKITPFCCGIGMRTALIQTREELNCIYDVYKTTKDPYFMKTKIYKIAYIDINLTRDFNACPEKIKAPEELFMEGQPDNMGNVQVMIGVNFKGTRNQIGFDDISGMESVNVMCQHILPSNSTD